MKLSRICPICGSENYEMLYELKLAKSNKEKILENSYIVFCNKCGFIFDNNDYTQNDYNEHYSSIKTSSTASAGTGGNRITDIQRYDFQIDIIEKFIQNKDIDILDIGCAKGGLLNRFRERGYNKIYGIEPEVNCHSILHEKNIVSNIGTIFDIEKFGKTFDVIMVSQVLEHIWDLKLAKNVLKNCLNKNGLLYIEVPNLEYYSEYFYKPFYYFNFEHINHFSKNTLNMLFNNFEILETNSSYFYMPNNKKYPILYSVFRNNENNSSNIVKDEYGIRLVKEYIQKSYEIESNLKLDIDTDYPVLLYGLGYYGRRVLMNDKIFNNINVVGIIDRNPTFKGFYIKIFDGKEIPVYTIENDNIDFLSKYNYNVNIFISSPIFENEIRDFLLKTNKINGKIIII
ncbi:class I SAM-dependent methyltransferase [Brachyspira intermedia]